MSIPTMAEVLARQLEPVLGMLRAAVESCPEEVWLAADGDLPVWEHAFHATVWLDAWMRTPDETFVAPAFLCKAALGMEPDAGPPVPRDVMLRYVEQVAAKCRALLARATDDLLVTEVQIMGGRFTLADQMLGQIRHVQHHVGSISAILRRRTGTAIGWLGYNEKAG